MRPRLAIAFDEFLQFQTLKQLLYGGIVRPGTARIQRVCQVTHGRPFTLPEKIENCQFCVGDVLRSSCHNILHNKRANKIPERIRRNVYPCQSVEAKIFLNFKCITVMNF